MTLRSEGFTNQVGLSLHLIACCKALKVHLLNLFYEREEVWEF